MCNVSNHTIWCNCHNRPSLKEQLAQARREGWEQGKREAEGIADTYFRASQINGHRSEIARKITKAIAAMEYGGRNEQSQRCIRSTKERSLRHSAHVF